MVWFHVVNYCVLLFMKILFLSTFYPPYIGGGVEITLKTLVDCLKLHGHQAVVLSIGSDKGLHVDEIDGIKVYRAGIRNIYFHFQPTNTTPIHRFLWHVLDIYNPLMSSYIHDVISTEKPDLVSCHNLTGWSVAAWDSISDHDIPVVQVLHDLYLLCARSTMFKGSAPCSGQCSLCRIMRLPHAKKSKEVSAVVGISKFILDRFVRYGYFHDTRLKEVIHNIRDVSRNQLPVHSRKQDGTIIFGFIGTLAPNKGVEMLLHVFMQGALSHWRLCIAGNGNGRYVSYLKERFQDSRITFLGYCKQYDFFSQIDICVVPSLWEEPLGMVVAESLLSGIPVIGSSRGGISEMITEDVNGKLFDPSIQGNLSSVIRDMADNLLFWKEKTESIRQSGEEFSDVENWVKSWENLYERLLLK